MAEIEHKIVPDSMYPEDLEVLHHHELVKLVRELGHIVRRLDEDNEYLEYWSMDLDGEHKPTPGQKFANIEKRLLHLEDALKGLSTKQPTKTQPELMDIHGACEFLKMPASSVYKLTASRTIPFLKPGKRLMFKASELTKWLENSAQIWIDPFAKKHSSH